MQFLEYFRRAHKKSATVAKDRLQIIVARERGVAGRRDYLPELHQELLQVIAKYEQIDHEKVTVSLDRVGECEVLELNIVLPGSDKKIEAVDPEATRRRKRATSSVSRDWR